MIERGVFRWFMIYEFRVSIALRVDVLEASFALRGLERHGVTRIDRLYCRSLQSLLGTDRLLE